MRHDHLFLLLCLLLLVMPVSATTTVFTVPDANDGTFQNTTTNTCTLKFGTAFNTVTTAYGTAAPRLTATTTSGQCSASRRFWWSVPTSDIGDTDIIDSAKFCFTGDFGGGNSKSNGLGSPTFTIVGFTPASFPIAASDGNTNGTAEYITAISYADMPENNVSKCVDFNAAGLAAISKTGNTSFTGLFGDWDLNGNMASYTWASGATTYYYIWDSGRAVLPSSVGFYPNLTVTYHTPDTTPPASITSLANQSLSCNTVDFSWTNPTDADYGGLMVWQNNTALSNLPNSSTYVNWTGLPGDADITFSSKTVDLLGNINATFVNMTAHTAVCPSPTRTVSPTLAPDTCDIEIPWCYTQNVFFWNLSSADVSGYQVLENYPELNNTAYQKVSVSSATGSQYLGQWVVPLGTFTETKTIAPGLWRFRTYHNVSSQVGVSTVEFKVFNRSASGNETDLFYGLSITKDVNELTPTEYLTSYARRNYTTFYPGDRLVIKMNASTTSVTARDVWVATAGNTQASMVEIGWFVCCDDGSCSCGTGGSGGEAVGAAFGIIGGILGAIIIFRRRGEMQ